MQLIEKNNKYYYEHKGKLEKAAIFTDQYYALKPYNGIAILEINGIRMHLVKEFKSPLDFPKEIVKLTNPKGKILETCFGLGYLTNEIAKNDVYIITCELKKEVIELAKINPNSYNVFNNKKIKIINKDCNKIIENTKDNEFDYIYHDPPSFLIAGELYSLKFYNNVYRILKPKGKFFHYIGSTGKNKNRDFKTEIIKRLEIAKFKNIKYFEKLQSFFCEK
jgi:hypothetical protein